MKTTTIAVAADAPTAIASTLQEQLLDVIAFNLSYIIDRNPILAVQLLKLYKQALQLKGVPPLPDSEQDLRRAHDAIQQILAE